LSALNTGRAQKKKMANAFLSALWNLVEDPKMQQWIHWNRAGNGFIVPNPAAFEAHACECAARAAENVLAAAHAAAQRGCRRLAAAAAAILCRLAHPHAGPVYFKHSRYTSFLRSLSYYSFVKNTSSDTVRRTDPAIAHARAATTRVRQRRTSSPLTRA
jgi:hypothetical protein